MAGPRFIQDSDDEDHDNKNPSPVVTSSVSPTCQRIIDPQSSPLSKLCSEEASTGSTDVLNRQIKDARDNLLKSSSDGPLSIIKSFPSSHQPFESPAGSRANLRRATTAISERKEKKPLKTYGSRASQDDSRIPSSDLYVRNHSSLPSTIGTSSFHEDGTREATRAAVRDGLNGMPLMTEDGTPEATRAAVRDGLNGMPLTEDEVGHGANSDPENILEQERVRGASPVSASPIKTQKEILIDGKSFELSDGRTMPLTPDETSALHGSLARTTWLKPQYSSDDPVSLPTLSKRSPAQVKEVLISDPIDTKSNKRPRFLLDLPDPCIAENIPAPESHNVSPTKRARTSRIDECGNQPDQDDTCDELSLSLSKQQPNHTTSKQSKTKRPREKDELDDEKLGSDEIGIGLPVEKYQPRPSRSRSGRQDDELIIPVDFSKKPEAAAKGRKKNKRRKTTAFEQLVHGDEDEMDIFQVKIPSLSKDAEKVVDVPTKNNPEATDQPQPEIDPSRDKSIAPPAKKRGRPRKQVSGIPEELENLDCDQSSPTNPTTAVPNPPTSKKRKAPLGHDSDQSSAEDFPPPPDTKIDIHDPPSRSSLSPSISIQKDPPVPVLVPLPVASIPITRSPSPANTNIMLSPILQTPPKTVPAKGPDKHSPINSGKVAYRVGLSKRARIEPLLRIVRK